MSYGFDLMFSVFPLLFCTVFLLVLAMFIVIAVKGNSQRNKNTNSPRLTVDAVDVAKRTDISRHHHGNTTGAHGHYTSTSTSYYVTFQVESGDRMELGMSGNEFGLLSEGDKGKLTFQGTRYLGFERE